MLKYLNSPLKATGILVMIGGLYIAIVTYQQFFFLGISVFSLGVLIQVTAGLFFKSRRKTVVERLYEMLLVLFTLSFCLLLLLDYLEVIKVIR